MNKSYFSNFALSGVGKWWAWNPAGDVLNWIDRKSGGFAADIDVTTDHKSAPQTFTQIFLPEIENLAAAKNTAPANCITPVNTCKPQYFPPQAARMAPPTGAPNKAPILNSAVAVPFLTPIFEISGVICATQAGDKETKVPLPKPNVAAKRMMTALDEEGSHMHRSVRAVKMHMMVKTLKRPTLSATYPGITRPKKLAPFKIGTR